MRPLVPAALGFAASLFLSELIGAYALIPAAACALIFIILFFVRRRSGASHLYRSAAIFSCVAAVAAVWHIVFSVVFYSPAVRLAGTEGRFSAVVRDYPDVYDYGSGVEVEIAEAGGARARLWFDEYVELEPGDRITFAAKLDFPERAPDFDFLEYYRAKRVFLSGEVSEILSVEYAESTPLRFLPKVWSRALAEKLELLYSGDNLAVVKALTVGDRSGLSDASALEIRASGLAHLLAISGLHITLLCGMILALFGGRRRGALFAIAFVLVFVLTSGASPSAARAFIMHTLALSAMLLRRDADPKSALSAALLVLLIVNPFSISDLGLQLSFLATLGLLMHLEGACDRLYERIKPKSRVLRTLLRSVAVAAATTAIATLYTAPLIAYAFGTLPLFGVFANLFAMLFVPIALAGGLLSGLLGLIYMPAAQVVAAVADPAVSALRFVAGTVARVPFSVVDAASPYNICAILLGYALFFIWRLTPGEKRGRLCAVAAAAALVLAMSLGEAERRSSGLEATFLDVGQGQSILLSSGGETALVDCGGDGYGGAGCIAAERLMRNGTRSLDALILTHYHADHANGVADLLEFVTVERAYLPPPFEESDGEVIELIRASGAEIVFVDEANTEISLGGASLTVFRPVARGSENEQGAAVLARCGEFELLMTGDLSATSEMILLGRNPLSSVEVIVAGHHGSRLSTGDWLLDMLTPQAAVISLGDNSYGHPHGETLARLASHGCDVYRTDFGGNIRLRVG